MNNILSQIVKLTGSGVAYTGACIFRGFLLGTDGANDPTITPYNNTAASGDELVPTCTYDASVAGLNGVTGLSPGIYCDKGIYIEITCAGAVEVSVILAPYNPSAALRWDRMK